MTDVEYFVLEGRQDGNPMTFRGIKEPLAHRAHSPHLISIFWEYQPFVEGLPNPDVNRLQNDFEDAANSLEEDGFGILCLCVFGNGRKEWHWYVADLDRWFVALNHRLKEHPQYPLRIEHVENDDWSYHGAFISWASAT